MGETEQAESAIRTWCAKRSGLILFVLVFLGSLGLLTIFLFWGSYAPFGGEDQRSLAGHDANIQYLDFFAYLKDVLAGKQSIGYTFSALLGGTGIGTFSYYLSSPVNILILFFDKSELNSFYNIAVIVKIAMACATMSYFLKNRFEKGMPYPYIVLLSLSYGMAAYSFYQVCNVIWLDGVYMLPIMMLGVYRVVTENKFITLVLATGLGILFNWYAAGMNCIFSGIWFVLELGLYAANNGITLKRIVKTTGLYALGGAWGACLAAWLFLPTVINLRDSKGDNLGIGLHGFGLVGNPLRMVGNYGLGATSGLGIASVFSGGLVLVGCLGYFLTRGERKQKAILGALLVLMVLMFYWKPLVYAFSLFTPVYSYWYRYGYLGSFILVFIAAHYFKNSHGLSLRLVVATVLSCGTIFALNKFFSTNPDYKILVTIVIVLGFLLATQVLDKFTYPAGKSLVVFVLAVLSFSEILLNSFWLVKPLTVDVASVAGTRNYITSESRLLETLRNRDPGFYRITQTTTRGTCIQSDAQQFFLNEALAYNYASTEGYNSTNNFKDLALLQALGYRTEGQVATVRETSLLPSDALLGVRYVLSPEPIPGLVPVDGLPETNRKQVFENPFSLPPVFVHEKSKSSANFTGNPFEYVNALYAEITGRQTPVFKPVPFESSIDGKQMTFTLDVARNGKFPVYGNIPWNEYADDTIEINGKSQLPYATWGSFGTFSVPVNTNDSTAKVTLNTENPGNFMPAQFYYADLDVLRDAVDSIQQNQPSQVTIQPGSADITVREGDSKQLFTSIPFNQGWTILNNGAPADVELFADSLISIDLHPGINRITMRYSVPFLWPGICLTAISAAALILLAAIKAMKLRRRPNPRETAAVVQSEANSR